ncbi:Alkylglycerol monooxygenase [Sciurus carolinensis]|uniref:Alkylglycerol monooxygenase n=1 Tax=Sciurus carolinensis TaxID=30640 RepID=A0AA41T0S8_SCICA|nr:Alkylglycerol monooxygenase [Sciurus carolinensis]
MKNPEVQQDVSISQGVRMMFYMMKPNETSFQTPEEVPDYVKKATPFFISLMLLELVINWICKGKPPSRLDDALTSLSAGILSRLPRLFFRSIEVTSYIYIWENYRLFSLPWDSPWTWYFTFLGVDFAYYWFHRMAHGTFEAEKERVAYGLTHPINTFEPLRVQVTGKEVPFSSSASQLLKIYTVVQFALMLAFYEETFANTAALSQVSLLLRVLFIILTLTSIGFLLDQRPKATIMETLRCLVFLMLYRFGHLKPLVPALSFVFEVSLLF